MKVTVQVDRAKIHQDLFFQYVEDPTIVRIEPEWSIVSGNTPIAVWGTHLDLIQNPQIRAKHGGKEHINVSLDFWGHGACPLSMLLPRRVWGPQVLRKALPKQRWPISCGTLITGMTG